MACVKVRVSKMETSLIRVQSPAIDLRRRLILRSISPRRFRTLSFSLPYMAASNSPPTTEILGSQSPNRMLIVGMGFVGKFVAQYLKMRGWDISGTCTDIMKKKKLEEMGFDVHIFDANDPDPEVWDILSNQTHLLVSIPPLLGIGDPMLQHEELIKSKLMEGRLKWLCYLSSTGVYGDSGGEWVDEDYPVRPTDKRSEARLAAEKGWLKLGKDVGISAQVFRLGGIYGPGRSAVDTMIKQGPLSETQRMRVSRYYTSRVHVHDICQALKASIDQPSFGRVYNVVDDDPTPRSEVFSYAQGLIDRKWPGHLEKNKASFAGPQIHSSAESSLTGKKRVSNERIKSELGVRLLYPSYKSGLKSIVEHMDNPFRLNQ